MHLVNKPEVKHKIGMTHTCSPQAAPQRTFRKTLCCATRAYLPQNAALPAISRTCFEGPFGEVLRATGPMAKANPFRFSTKYQDDETGLLYYGYRYYNASTGRWASRDPGAYSEAINLYGFNAGDPIDYTDFLGLYVVYSEGYAFRDPWYGSLGAQRGSGSSQSTAASYSGWGSPWRTAICNSGVLYEGPDGDYPSERTSFVKASLWYFDRCTKRYRVTCKATLKGRVWGRLNQGPPNYLVNGSILGEPALPSETTTTPIDPGGSAFTMQFQKTVTKDIALTQDSKRPYILYHLFMPIALQVKNHFRGGFSESGEASCTITGSN